MAKIKSLGESVGVGPKKMPMDDYETEGHLRTLMDAEKIKNDPDKMKKVHKLAGRHSKAIKSIQDLKDTYDEKFGKGALKPKGQSSVPGDSDSDGM